MERVQNKIFYFKLITKLLNYMFVRRLFFSQLYGVCTIIYLFLTKYSFRAGFFTCKLISYREVNFLFCLHSQHCIL